jgi:hypothetical protein
MQRWLVYDCDLEQRLDAGRNRIEPLFGFLVALRAEPVGSPADEVRGEGGGGPLWTPYFPLN